jgi:hypothetical protein
MVGVIDRFFGGKKKPAALQGKLWLEDIATRLPGEEFHAEGEGLLSKDGVVAIYHLGRFESKFRDRYQEFAESSLTRKDTLIGNGENWYNLARFSGIMKGIGNLEHRLLLSRIGMSPAIITLKNAEIVIAPFVP